MPEQAETETNNPSCGRGYSAFAYSISKFIVVLLGRSPSNLAQPNDRMTLEELSQKKSYLWHVFNTLYLPVKHNDMFHIGDYTTQNGRLIRSLKSVL
jgi:hypothetical protein